MFLSPDFIHSFNQNLNTQQRITQIGERTKNNKMQLSLKKGNLMISNFCKEYQFTRKIQMEGEVMKIVIQAIMLGVVIKNTLT